MVTSCSVRRCSRSYLRRFGEISLCQAHWQQWCRSTWWALKFNVQQPIMEDWIVAVGVEETAAIPILIIEPAPLKGGFREWAPEKAPWLTAADN